MLSLTNFEVGELITIDGRELRFEGLVPPEVPRTDGTSDIQFLDARHRRAVIFTPAQFYEAYWQQRIQYHRSTMRVGDQTGEDESSSKAIRRRWRLFWTTTYDKFPVPKSTDKLQALIDAHKEDQPDPVDHPSPHTLRTWLRDRGEQGDRRPRQMGDRGSKAPNRHPVHDFVQDAYDQASQRYWSNYKMTFEDLQIQVRGVVIAENERRDQQGSPPLKVPGRTTLWRWLQQERTYENTASRLGRRRADRLFKGIRNSLKAKRILDVAVLDQKHMDVHVYDPSRKWLIGRPWLALIIDVKSRMVLGYSLSWEDPSVLTLMACVRSAMRGQPDFKLRCPSVEGEWEAFGVPRTILVDNAWENTGSSFVDACADNGISIEWAPVRRPEHKGIVERFFSRLDDQLVHKLPGAVTDKPHVLAERQIDPRSDACLTLADLDALVARYIVDDYSCQPHAGLNANIPLRVWREGAERDGIELAHDLASVEHAMSKRVRNRTLTHEGVKFLGLTYRSSAVDMLLADLLPGQEPGTPAGSARVKVGYHPENLSQIFVWNEARNQYVALPCIDKEYSWRLSERVHLELRRRHREDNETFVTSEEGCLRRAALQTEIRDSFDKQPLKERRRKARMLSGSLEASSQDPTISIDPISNRSGGDRPEKGAVRSRSSRARKTEPQSAETQDDTVLFDPFASRDRSLTIAKSLERLS